MNNPAGVSLISKLRSVRVELARIQAKLVSLKQEADTNAENPSNQPPLPPMSEAE